MQRERNLLDAIQPRSLGREKLAPGKVPDPYRVAVGSLHSCPPSAGDFVCKTNRPSWDRCRKMEREQRRSRARTAESHSSLTCCLRFQPAASCGPENSPPFAETRGRMAVYQNPGWLACLLACLPPPRGVGVIGSPAAGKQRGLVGAGRGIMSSLVIRHELGLIACH